MFFEVETYAGVSSYIIKKANVQEAIEGGQDVLKTFKSSSISIILTLFLPTKEQADDLDVEFESSQRLYILCITSAYVSARQLLPLGISFVRCLGREYLSHSSKGRLQPVPL